MYKSVYNSSKYNSYTDQLSNYSDPYPLPKFSDPYNNYSDPLVLADTGAGGSVFNDKRIVYNIRKNKMPYGMVGIGGALIVVNDEGDSEFGVVGYHPKSGMNILSIGELLDECSYIELNKKKRSLILQMEENGAVYIFKRVNPINPENLYGS